jgi:hypothetical protein
LGKKFLKFSLTKLNVTLKNTSPTAGGYCTLIGESLNKSVPYKRGLSEYRYTQREDQVKIHGEGSHLLAKERGLRRNQSADTLILDLTSGTSRK